MRSAVEAVGDHAAERAEHDQGTTRAAVVAASQPALWVRS